MYSKIAARRAFHLTRVDWIVDHLQVEHDPQVLELLCARLSSVLSSHTTTCPLCPKIGYSQCYSCQPSNFARIVAVFPRLPSSKSSNALFAFLAQSQDFLVAYLAEALKSLDGQLLVLLPLVRWSPHTMRAALSLISSLIPKTSKQCLAALVPALKNALLNFINTRHCLDSLMDAQFSQVIDPLLQFLMAGCEKKKREQEYYPLLALLVIVSPWLEIEASDRRLIVLDMIFKSCKKQEVGLVCAVHILKANALLYPQISCLSFWCETLHLVVCERIIEKPPLLEVPMAIECASALYFTHQDYTLNTLFPALLDQAAPDSHRCLLTAICRAILVLNPISYNTTFKFAPLISRIFVDRVMQATAPGSSSPPSQHAKRLKQKNAYLDTIILDILECWTLHPSLLFRDSNGSVSVELLYPLFRGLCHCVLSPDFQDKSIECITSIMSVQSVSPWVLLLHSDPPLAPFWMLSNYTLTTLCKTSAAIYAIQSPPLILASTLKLVLSLCQLRLEFLKYVVEINPLVLSTVAGSAASNTPAGNSMSSGRYNASVAVESLAILMSTSKDEGVCHASASILAVLHAEYLFVEEQCGQSAGTSCVGENLDMYTKISMLLSTAEPAETSLAPKAEFKSGLRQAFMLAKTSSPGITTAWEEIYGLWRIDLATILKYTVKVDDKKQAIFGLDGLEFDLEAWALSTSTLASLGHISKTPALTPLSKSRMAEESSPGAARTPGSARSNDFYKETAALLTCAQTTVAEISRTVLSQDVPLPAIKLVIAVLTQMAKRLFSEEQTAIVTEKNILQVENTAHVIKSLLNLPGSFSTSDYIPVISKLCTYMHGLDRIATDQSISIKTTLLTSLTALLAKRGIAIDQQQEVFRNQMAYMIIEWTSMFLTESLKSATLTDQQRRLDSVALKALAALFMNLRLVTITNHDSSVGKQQGFLRYFTYFTKVLEISDRALGEQQQQDQERQSQEAVLALSNLCASNSEFGLVNLLRAAKTLQTMPHTRRLVLQTLGLALTQESASQLRNSSIDESRRFERLVGVCRLDSYAVIVALAKVASAQDMAGIAAAVYTLGLHNGDLTDLACDISRQEVLETEISSTLFRRNSVASATVALYMSAGLAKFTSTSLKNAFFRLESNESSFEVDPAKCDPANLAQNQQNLIRLCELFLDSIFANAELILEGQRQFLKRLGLIVQQRFPDSVATFICSLVFLRIVCPLVVSPPSYFLAKPLVPSAKRGTLLVTKIIQNLANRVNFGAKEAFMEPFNALLEKYRPKIDAFVGEITVPAVLI